MPRVLLHFAHPAYELSRVNRHLVEAAQQVEGITFRDLYELYPDFDVDVAAEQRLMEEHDIAVFQHPFYWYSVPPLLKQWQDLVLQHDWAYGQKGKALHGKAALHVFTSGGSDASYQHDGRNHYTIDELLRPLEQTARLCGMRWLAPYAVTGTHAMGAEEMKAHAAAYRARLEALVAEGS